MGLWSNLFGTSKIIDDGMELIDNAFYTDEEKTEQKKQMLKAYEPFKLAQRLIAIMFCFTFLLLLVGLVVMSFFVDITVQLDVIEKYMESSLLKPVMMILGFYFAGGMLEGVIERAKKK
ncbi:hypothetical protein [Vibrio mediterranei]|uniref:hypothetical protein n=1 Tax=Vibrio mediterranei TaxID=689 RepID=UPI001EFC5FBD|nr:hypothetical protein [Vibrio mediterranei]MCG9659729.1 hypothetical protein [Vibrio mediterranei]